MVNVILYIKPTCEVCADTGYASAWCPNCEVKYEHNAQIGEATRNLLDFDYLIQVQPDGHFACEMCDPDVDPDNLELTECSICERAS